MFVVSLRDLREGPLLWEEETSEPGAVWPDAGVDFVGAASFRAEARLAPDGAVHVEGTFETAIRVPCRRCLADLERPLSIPVDVWYRREVEDGEGAVFPLPQEARVVDLVPALREELLLAIPSFPECEEPCAGLCPGCGARLDEEACDCTFDEPDPRWDALRALR